jgi:hypothetical protein
MFGSLPLGDFGDAAGILGAPDNGVVVIEPI